MYKIVWKNKIAHTLMVEYGFSRYIAKRVASLLNEDYALVQPMLHLPWQWQNFKRCLCRYARVIKSAKNF